MVDAQVRQVLSACVGVAEIELAACASSHTAYPPAMQQRVGCT